jgi:site-specific DNA-methyltransferase (adenine-specific)
MCGGGGGSSLASATPRSLAAAPTTTHRYCPRASGTFQSRGAIKTQTMMNKVIFADCIEILPNFSDNSFDLAHVDPPYFSGPEKRGFYGKKISTSKIKRVDYDKTDTWQLPDANYFDELFRVSKNQIIWGANYFTFKNVSPFKTPRRHELDAFIAAHPTGWIIWDKCNGSSSFNDFELEWTSFDEPTYVYKFMWNGMMQGKSELQGHIQQGNKALNQKRIHPTEKPIGLYRYVNHKHAQKGWRILDTHLGSGSHRIAALDLGFSFFGIEKDLTHFENQRKRFQNYQGVIKIEF